MPVKQVIVVRTRYPDGKGGFFKPRTGKLIAQGAHASLKVFLDRKELMVDSTADDPENNLYMEIGLTSAMSDWVTGSFTKVVTQVKDEEELLDLLAKAKEAGLPCALVTDKGRTEFKGVPTNTCIAIGPAYPEEIDPITGHLKLL